MKNVLFRCVLLSLVIARLVSAEPTPAASAPAKNPFGVWAYMGALPTLSQTPYVRGKLVKAAWADLEPSPGEWNWNGVKLTNRGKPKRAHKASINEEESTFGLDADLAAAAKADLQIVVVVFSGSHAPAWIYDKGVPRVKVTGTRGVQSDLYPYYLNDTYQELFRNMIVKVKDHIDQLPREIRRHVMAVQAGFSSTGDYGPYHGTLVDAKYEISDGDWLAYYKKMALFYQQQYAHTQPLIRLLFNPSNSPDAATELIAWLNNHCPHAIIKAGNTGHMYQINGEREQIQVLRTQLFTKAGDDYLRARSEFGEDSTSGGWLEAPAWNMYSLLQAALYTGLDFDCFERGDTLLADRRFFPAFEFFNRYAGRKDPATAPGAWCGLRDGLDSADTDRFPEAQFGDARIGNSDRAVKIAAAYAAAGAKQGDPSGGTHAGVRSRSVKALNDVGWEIYRGNYEVFLQQIDPANTSIGHWRVGPKDQPYGRYARGFDHAAGKDTMSFRLDPRFLNNGGGRQADVHIVYFDEGTGSWAFHYQDAAGALKRAVTVQKKNTHRWQEITVPLDNAGFGGKGAQGCDFQLQNTDAEDDIFQLVEVLRRPVPVSTAKGA